MLRISDKALLSCVEQFLGAAAEQNESRWEVALQLLAKTFRASGASLEIVNSAHDSHQQVMAWMPPSATHLDQYVAEAFHQNPRVAHSLTTGPLTVHFDRQFADERGLDRDPFYRFMESWRGLRYYLGAEILRTQEHSSYLCIHRTRKEGHAEPDDVRAFQRLLPSLRHAASLYTRLNKASVRARLADTLLDRLGFAALLFDGCGRICEYNEKAEALLLAGVLGIRYGRLCVADSTTQTRIETAIQRLIAEEVVDIDLSPPAIRLSAHGPHSRHVLLLNRLPRRPLFSVGYAVDAHILALVVDLTRDQQTGGLRRTLSTGFGLTPREAMIASRVGRGAAPANVANELAVSIHTVRSQLKSVFAKTGSKRQADLAALVTKIEASLRLLE